MANEFYQNVRLQMTRDQILNYKPKRRGLSINFYAPIVDGVNLLHQPKDDWNKNTLNWVDVTISGSTNFTNPLEQRDMRDINEELAMMDSKFKILKDHLKNTDRKDLITDKNIPLFNHETFLNHPALDGQNDHMRSKAKNVHDVVVPMSQVKEMEKHFEKRKAFYPTRQRFNDIKATGSFRDSKEKFAVLEFGQISN